MNIIPGLSAKVKPCSMPFRFVDEPLRDRRSLITGGDEFLELDPVALCAQWAGDYVTQPLAVSDTAEP